ncbi:MAG: FecR domain-containing protein [Oleispira sp.]|nr:FecR domain-containing protein [Oleispira sp.]
MNTVKQFFTVILVALLYLISHISLAAPAPTDSSGSTEELLYTVKKNDTVWGICKTYVNDPMCWKKLVEYNHLANPKYLPPKSTIRIPKTWLINSPTTALVIAVEGDVLVVRKGSTVEFQLKVGDQLSQQDVVKSMNGTAMIKFSDDSRLLLKANSTIRMASLQFYNSSQLVNTRVELLKGRVKAQVEKLSNKNSSYEISTPAAVAAVRGTDFRVARAESEAGEPVVMRTELLTGALQVSSNINQQNITAGQAVMAVEGKGVAEPVELLPRPLMALNSNESFNLPLNFTWLAIEGAISYKITLMTNDAQVWEKVSVQPEVLIEDIDPGNYQLLIRGVDKQGFEGRNRHLNLNFSAAEMP